MHISEVNGKSVADNGAKLYTCSLGRVCVDLLCGGGCAGEEYAYMLYMERDAGQWWDDKKTVH